MLIFKIQNLARFLLFNCLVSIFPQRAHVFDLNILSDARSKPHILGRQEQILGGGGLSRPEFIRTRFTFLAVM